MATLADAFLQDLEELIEESGDANAKYEVKDEYLDLDLPIPNALEVYEQQRSKLSVVVTNLNSDPDFIDVMTKVREFVQEPQKQENGSPHKAKESDLELVERCNAIMAVIDNELMNIHRFIKDIYSKKFPELDSIVYTPLEYIACVKRIHNRTDLSGLDLSDLISNSTIMAIAVAISTTSGAVLPQGESDIVAAACEEAMQMAECRKDVLTFLESNMTVVAPNVTNILGSTLTSKLLSHVGGIDTLARMPSHNIMHVGSQKRKSMSMSAASHQLTQGVICQCDIILNTPKEYQNKAIKLVSGKTGLAARIDSFKQASDGSIGTALRDQIILALMKSQEPPQAPPAKPLPIPDEKARRRRGGKKYRKMKEKYGATEVQKAANRMVFGVEAEKTYGLEEEEGFGMIGNTGSLGKLKVHAKKSKVQIPKKRMQHLANHPSGSATAVGSSTHTGGMTSSLSFTPLQGIELAVPQSAGGVNEKASLSSKEKPSTKIDYFAASAKFR